MDGLVGNYLEDDRADACRRAKRLADCLPGEEALIRFMGRAAQLGDTPLVIALGLIVAGQEPTPDRVTYLMRD